MKVLLAFGALGAALYQILTYQITKKRFDSLPIAEGKVIKSKLDNYNDIEGKRVYSANIQYTYSLGSDNYTCNTIALRSFQLIPDYSFESKLLEKYKEGDTVSVKYNPKNPSESYLEVAPLSIFSAIAVFAATAGVIAYFVFFEWVNI